MMGRHVKNGNFFVKSLFLYFVAQDNPPKEGHTEHGNTSSPLSTPSRPLRIRPIENSRAGARLDQDSSVTVRRYEASCWRC